MTDDEFLENLRDALNHLYDSAFLRRSTLYALFMEYKLADDVKSFQKILINAIATLKPDDNVPSATKAWRVYDLLFCRYVQQMTADTVADQLGIGNRHLRREQLVALDALAHRLKNRYTLNLSEPDKSWTAYRSNAVQVSPAISEELAWLSNSTDDQSTLLNPAVSAAVKLMQALSDKYRTTIDLINDDSNINLAVHPVALNQILINILSVAIPWLSSSQVHVESTFDGSSIDISFSGSSFYSSPRALTQQEMDSLALAQQLAEMASGTLIFSTNDLRFEAHLSLSAYKSVTVLVIDDNADTIKLLQHFTRGTRYHLIGTQDPGQVVDLVKMHTPQIIMLDVLMPQVDGWQVLGQLLQHPATQDLPIIVSTILGQKELALSLGASGFAQKPLTKDNFLSALDQQLMCLI